MVLHKNNIAVIGHGPSTRGRKLGSFINLCDTVIRMIECDWQEEIPGQLVSYKGDVRPNQNRLPRNARIVSAHGKPRPHEINAEWIKSCWWGK